jgi:hypothetical protein
MTRAGNRERRLDIEVLLRELLPDLIDAVLDALLGATTTCCPDERSGAASSAATPMSVDKAAPARS